MSDKDSYERGRRLATERAWLDAPETERELVRLERYRAASLTLDRRICEGIRSAEGDTNRALLEVAIFTDRFLDEVKAIEASDEELLAMAVEVSKK